MSWMTPADLRCVPEAGEAFDCRVNVTDGRAGSHRFRRLGRGQLASATRIANKKIRLITADPTSSSIKPRHANRCAGTFRPVLPGSSRIDTCIG